MPAQPAPGGELGDHGVAGGRRDPEVAGQLGEREPLVGAGGEGLDEVDEALGLGRGTGHGRRLEQAPVLCTVRISTLLLQRLTVTPITPRKGPFMYDLMITGGTIVDGTGADAFVGDVAVTDGVDRRRRRARSTARPPRPSTPPACVVTPGFVDIHSHYDGQVIFDDSLAPVHRPRRHHRGRRRVRHRLRARPHRRPRAARRDDGVGGGHPRRRRCGPASPGSGRASPSTSTPSTAARYAMDVAAQIGHVALRTYVMGRRALENEPATRATSPRWRRLVARGHRGRRTRLLDLPGQGPRHPRRRARSPAPSPARTSCSGIAAGIAADRPAGRVPGRGGRAPTARTPRAR